MERRSPSPSAMAGAAALLTALFLLTVHAIAEDMPAVRVVVQHPVLGPVMDSRDGYALVTAARHVVELHSTTEPRLLRMMEFTAVVDHAVLGPDGRWCIVSAGQRMIRIDLSDMSERLIVEDAAGMLALDGESKRLAVLGRLPLPPEAQAAEPAFKHDRWDRHWFGGAVLGVWDLENEQWMARIVTPIWVDSHGYRGSPGHLPGWEGDIVRAEGADRGIMARRIMGNRWLVRLDGATSEHEIIRGPENETWDRRWMWPALGAARDAMDRASAELATLWENQHARRWSQHRDHTLVFTETKEGNLVVAVPWDRGVYRTLHIGRDGEIRLNPPSTGHVRRPPRAMAGRLVVPRQEDRRWQMFDLVAGERLAILPERFDLPNRLGWLWYLPTGWMLVHDELLYYYEPGREKPLWTAQYVPAPPRYPPAAGEPALPPRRTILHAPVASPRGRLVAVCTNPSEHNLQVRRLDDGHVVMRLDAALEGSVGAAFDEAGERLAVADAKTLRVYRVGDGALLGTVEHGMRHRPSVHAAEEGWVLSIWSEAMLLDGQLEKRFELDVSGGEGLRSIQAVGDVPASRLLLLGERGDLSVADAVTGQRERHWPQLLTGGSLRSGGPGQAEVIWGGRALVRNTGYAGTIEQLALPDLDPILRIRCVPIGEDELGWVAWTPDGRWDASPGAEQFVYVLQGLDTVAADVEARRSPETIRRQIADLTGQGDSAR
jgi:hypothetical protein